MKRASRYLAVLAATACAAPVAARDLPPEGWSRHEHDTSGINEITLSYREPGAEHVALAFLCSRNFSEVDFAYYADMPDAPDGAEWTVLLRNEHGEYAFDATGRQSDGTHLIAAKVTFDRNLSALLVSEFTVIADGAELGRYTAGDGRDDIRATIDACQDR